MGRLVKIVRGHPYPLDAEAPQMLLVSPPPVSRTENAEFADMFAGGDEASPRTGRACTPQLADEVGCGFFDAGTVAETTPLDGVHLDAENTRAIGKALAPWCACMLEL